MQLLLGKPAADRILAQLKENIGRETAKPGLAVILVGEDKASQIYVSLKEKRAQEIGINFFRFDFPRNSSTTKVIEKIEMLNKDSAVHGIIVQLPLPDGFDTEKIITSIDPKKDADGFHRENVTKFLQGSGNVWPVFPRAIMRLLESSGEILKGKKALVIANSDEFGRVMMAALERSNLSSDCILSSNISSNLEKIKGADVTISAVGSPGLLNGQMLKNGSVVIDGGIEEVNGKVMGDVDFGSTEALSGFITPVPGGVGPLTIACLLENTFQAFKAQQKEK